MVLLIRAGDIQTNQDPKKTVSHKVFSLEFKWNGSSWFYQTPINRGIHCK